MIFFCFFLGIGWVVVLIVFYIDFFYNVVIVWFIYFLFFFFMFEFLWVMCGYEWNIEYCYEGKFSVVSGNGSEFNSILEGIILFNLVFILVIDVNSINSINVIEEVRKIFLVEEYFK